MHGNGPLHLCDLRIDISPEMKAELQYAAPANDAAVRCMTAAYLKPIHVHCNGCMHSEEPQVIIHRGVRHKKDGSVVDESLNEEVPRESKLASGLYFKRCDGLFKNIKGKTLDRKVGED